MSASVTSKISPLETATCVKKVPSLAGGVPSCLSSCLLANVLSILKIAFDKSKSIDNLGDTAYIVRGCLRASRMVNITKTEVVMAKSEYSW